MQLWGRSRNTFQELVLLFHHAGSGNKLSCQAGQRASLPGKPSCWRRYGISHIHV